MKLSIVLISWNAQAYVKPCLDSILAATEDIETEIIFIDNDSTDETGEILKWLYPQIIYKLNDKNLGVAKARNIGIKMTTGDYILILDIDTEVNTKAFSEMIAYLDIHSKSGIVACKLTSAIGQPQISCLKYPTLHHKFNNLILALIVKYQKCFKSNRFDIWASKLWKYNERYFYKKEMNENQPFECEYVIGACQCCRREAVLQVGDLDEHIFYGPEDADFCLRMRQKGWQVIYLPHVSIIHHYQKITNKKIFSKMSCKHIMGLLYFFKKYKYLNKIKI